MGVTVVGSLGGGLLVLSANVGAPRSICGARAGGRRMSAVRRSCDSHDVQAAGYEKPETCGGLEAGRRYECDTSLCWQRRSGSY